MYERLVKLFLRLAIGGGFLSAVADRFGFWKESVAWGNWENFATYTHSLLPWMSIQWAQVMAVLATAGELLFAIALIIGWKTKLISKLSGVLLLIFALTMSFSLGIKKPLDFSVFVAAAAAFSLSTMKIKFLELDELLRREN